MALLKGGDHHAFAMIYERYKGLLYLHAVKLLRNEDDAQDVVQELFAALWQRAPHLNVEVPLNAYLYRAIRNKIFDIFSRQKTSDTYAAKFANVEARGIWVTDEKVRENELIKSIEEGISQLPEKMREVFRLSRFNHMSHKEIAAELNISDKTVKTQINKAIKILKMKINLFILMTILFLFMVYLMFPKIPNFHIMPINFQVIYNQGSLHP